MRRRPIDVVWCRKRRAALEQYRSERSSVMTDANADELTDAEQATMLRYYERRIQEFAATFRLPPTVVVTGTLSQMWLGL